MAATQDTLGAQTANGMARLPPQNIDAEMAVIASIMLMPGVLDDLTHLRSEHFYADRHQKIYTACRTLHEERVVCDAVTVAQALDSQQRLAEIGGVDYLTKVMETVPNAAHAVYYANIVIERAMSRNVIYTCSELINAGYSGTDGHQLIESAESRVMAIRENDGATQAEPFGDVLFETLQAIQQRIDNQQEISGLATEWHRLDEQLSGLQPGNMIIVAARPSMGKTAFACGMILGASHHGPALVFSLEQSKLELAERILATQAGINGVKIKNGKIDNVEFDGIALAAHEVATRPIFIDDRPSRKVCEIASIARRVKHKHGLAIVVIDYLQLIQPEDQKTHREQQVATISRRLKHLARELQVPIVVLAQLNREVEQRPDKRPRLADLRESGSLEQDADVVLLLHRPSAYDPEESPGEAEIIVAKHRNGPIGTVKLIWRADCLRFENESISDHQYFQAQLPLQ